jgi:hypothetical protein
MRSVGEATPPDTISLIWLGTAPDLLAAGAADLSDATQTALRPA